MLKLEEKCHQKKYHLAKFCLKERAVLTSTVDVTEITEDPENRIEIKIDNEKKIISYRDEERYFYMRMRVSETNSLKLTKKE